MTIICAVRERGVGTWIAADQLVSATDGSKVGHVRKWVHGKKFSIAVAGSATTIDALAHHIGRFKPTMSNFDIGRVMRGIYKAMGAGMADKDGLPTWPNSIIFATADRLITFCNEGGGCFGNYDDFMARGSGAPYAEGAWSALRSMPRLTVRVRLIEAVRASCEWDTNSGGNPYIALITAKGVEQKFG